MHQTALSQNLSNSLNASVVDDTVASLVVAVHDWAVKEGKAIHDAIDTAEERAAIEAVLGAKFDEKIAPYLNSNVSRYIRMGTMSAIDAILITASGVSNAVS
jgi:hypothetical protein